jgi:hypothetical protein
VIRDIERNEETGMSSNKVPTMIAALVFLCLAALCLYRLLVGFPVQVGGVQLGQTASFLGFVAFAALSLMLFRGARGRI